jgi:hypothetical protein
MNKIAVKAVLGLERVKGIEPSSQAWEARILPLDHTRNGHSVRLPLLRVKPTDM